MLATDRDVASLLILRADSLRIVYFTKGFETRGHAVTTQGQAALSLIARLDGNTLDTEARNVYGYKFCGSLQHCAESSGISIANPEHFVSVADLKS